MIDNKKQHYSPVLVLAHVTLFLTYEDFWVFLKTLMEAPSHLLKEGMLVVRLQAAFH